MCPKKLNINLSSYEYSMEVDIMKEECNPKETPHWHLCFYGRRIGEISVTGQWIVEPEAKKSVKFEAEALTKKYSSLIREYFAYNYEHGYDY